MPAVTAAQRAKLNRDPISDAHIILLEFQEDSRAVVHRAAINNEDVSHVGNVYVATDISIKLPTSGDRDAAVRLDMSNISRIVGAAVNRARNRVGCRIKMIDISNPDVALIDTKNLFILGTVSGNSVRISADLGPRATMHEPVPFRRTSRAFFPGVFFTA